MAWSVSPCVEWYIVDDSYGAMPPNPGNTTKVGPDTMIDGENYIFSSAARMAPAARNAAARALDQYYSMRKKGRDCGTISVSEHFKAWAANGMPLGKIDQAQILVETGGGTGRIDFSVANVTLTPP